MNTSLYHHGVKGMKWGVRKSKENAKGHRKGAKESDYKDYGDGRIEIKKGTNMQRLIGEKNKQDIAGETYASFTSYDNNSYIKNIAGKGFLGGGRDTILNMKATADLKSPSANDAGKMLFTLMKNNKQFRDDYEKVAWGKKYSDKELSDLSEGKDSKKLFDEYKMANAQFMFPSMDNIKNGFYSELQKNGYNMLRDENDVGGGYAKSPVILLDGSKTLKIESKQKIDDRMRTSSKVYVKLYKKQGEEWMKNNGFK